MLKYHGGKEPIAGWIRSKFRTHRHYVEPFFGGGAVLFTGLPGVVSEVVNDLDYELMNFWAVVASPTLRAEFASVVTHLPVSESLYASCTEQQPDFGVSESTSRAIRFFILSRQSMGGRMANWHPLSKRRTRGGMNEQASAWMGAIDSLAVVAYRLQTVAIRCAPALQVIEQEDTSDTLFYLDPPYLQETRTAGGYKHEMSTGQHQELLSLARGLKGQVFVSGYKSSLYDRMLSDWKCHTLPVANHAASGDRKRTMIECLWEKPC